MPPRSRRWRYPCLFRPAAPLVSPSISRIEPRPTSQPREKKAISLSRDQIDSVATSKHDSEQEVEAKAIAPLLLRESQRF
ncbi:hypothetical protein V8C26DRAFT_201719 [Trichoderma gracile]